MFGKLGYDKWREIVALRVWNLTQWKKPLVVRDGDTVLSLIDFSNIITIDEGHTKISSSGLNAKGNLVGMGGFYYSPILLWGGTVENVLSSWRWLINQMNLDERQFQAWIELEAILALLVTGCDQGLLLFLLSLAADLYDLFSQGIDVTSKTSELGKQARAHMKKRERLVQRNKAKAIAKVSAIRLYMADLSSESRLARLARFYGHEVELRTHPDLIIDGKDIEVKRIRARFLSNRPNQQAPPADLSNPIKRGLRQNADIIAIQDIDLDKRRIEGFKATWLGTDALDKVLGHALKIENKGRCVLLFCGTYGGYFGRIILVKKAHTCF